MKKPKKYLNTIGINRALALAAIGAVITLYGLRLNATGKNNDIDLSPVQLVENEKIFRYDRENQNPIAMGLFETRLFFGLSRMEEGVAVAITTREWESFLDASVRPHFESFTIIDAVGEYRGLRESTKVLMILHQGGVDEHKIRSISNDYITRFDQDGVLRIDG